MLKEVAVDPFVGTASIRAGPDLTLAGSWYILAMFELEAIGAAQDLAAVC